MDILINNAGITEPTASLRFNPVTMRGASVNLRGMLYPLPGLLSGT